MSFSAYLYMSDAELANDLRKLTKPKKDQAHPGQLTYVHWINCINDSRSIIRQYGLMPEIKNSDDLKDMFPPMSTIYDYLEATNGGDAKHECTAVAQHYYGNLTMPSRRTLTKHAFYKESSSLLIHLKLMHACALKTLKPANIKTPFLTAGIYIACKAKPQDFRNSLRYKKGDGPENEKTLDRFDLFRLTSNEVYLSPLSSAAHLFKTKSSANTQDNKQRKKHQRDVNKWKNDSKDGVYVPMPVVEEHEEEDGADKGPVKAVNSDEEDSKALTKAKFKKPMGALGRALEKCRKEHAKNSQEHMLVDVLTNYNTIQEMVGYGKLFDGVAIKHEEDDEEDEHVDGDEEDSEREEEDDNSEFDSDETDDSSESANGSGTSSDDGVAGEYNTESTKDDASEPNDGNDSHGGSADDKDNSDQNPENVNDQDDAKNKDALPALYEYIDKLGGKVVKAGMAAKEIQLALGLKTTPSFRKPKEKAYFCSLRSDDMELIKKLYQGDDSEEVKAEMAKKEWLSPLVMLMQALGWTSSINGLPENSSLGADNEILLWNSGEVMEMFM